MSDILDLVRGDALVQGVVIALVGMLGLVIGSFLNVVVYRVPRDLSIVHPPSACPSCHTRIGARDNIPVVSWLVLRGRCRACRAPISARYPLVEAGTGIAFALTAWWTFAAGFLALLPLALVLVAFGIALAMIDIDVHRLPNALVLPLYPVTLVGLAFATVAGGDTGSGRLWSALAGAGAWLLVVGGIWLLTSGRGMGFGDVKLAPVLGAFTGWVGFGASLVGLLGAFVIGSLASVLVLGMRSGRGHAGKGSPAVLAGDAGHLATAPAPEPALRGKHIAFGPFLLAGAALGAFGGPAVASWYVSFAVGGG